MPDVTVVMVHRERFTEVPRAIRSVTRAPGAALDLVVVDGGSPSPYRERIAAAAEAAGARLIRTEQWLLCNEARLLGLRDVTSPWVVFVDSEIELSDGWLASLLSVGERTGAAAVSPVVCMGRPWHTHVHWAGGDTQVVEDEDGVARIRTTWLGQLPPYPEAGLVTGPTPHIEFHCALVRREWLERAPLDPWVGPTDHTDFSLAVREAGGELWMDADSVASFPTAPVERREIPFFLWHWSDAVNRKAEARMAANHGAVTDHHVSRTFCRPHRLHAMPRLVRVLRRVPGGLGTRAYQSAVRHVTEVMISRHRSDLPTGTRPVERVPPDELAAARPAATDAA